MSGFDDLESQLLDAIGRRAQRRRPTVSAMIVAASAIVVVALAAFAIVSLGHRTPPPSSPPPVAASHTRRSKPPQPSARQLSYINAAMDAVVNRDPTCGLRPGPLRGPTLSDATPSATMLSVLGVLRRPATPADRLPSRFYGNGHLHVATIASSVYVRYIRRARVLDGVSYYIIPAARVGMPHPPAATLERCYAEETRALRGELAHVPAPLRHATLRDGAQIFGQTRNNLAQEHVHEGVFELAVRANAAGGGGGMSPTVLAQRGDFGTDGPVLYGVVPSGVAAVMLRWPASHQLPSLTTTTDVVNNVFVVSVARVTGGNFPSTITWLAANGRVIKTVIEPTG